MQKIIVFIKHDKRINPPTKLNLECENNRESDFFVHFAPKLREKAVFIEIGFFSQIYCKNQTLTLRLGFGHHLIELKLEGFFYSFAIHARGN